MLGMIAVTISAIAFGIVRYRLMTLFLVRDSLRLGRRWREQRIAWSHTDGLGVAAAPGASGPGELLIGRGAAGEPHGGPQGRPIGPQMIAAETFGLTAAELLRLLDAWRKHALAQPA